MYGAERKEILKEIRKENIPIEPYLQESHEFFKVHLLISSLIWNYLEGICYYIYSIYSMIGHQELTQSRSQSTIYGVRAIEEISWLQKPTILSF